MITMNMVFRVLTERVLIIKMSIPTIKLNSHKVQGLKRHKIKTKILVKINAAKTVTS